MTLNLTAVLRVEGQAAKAELAAATSAVQKLGTETERQAASQRANTTATNAATAATGRAAQANRTFAVSQGQAAAATGNLVANFNDIGVMLAAGQNPLQLAIQQGTQITQVIGGQGAAGAANLLSTAFVTMLSPINLVTIGFIAAGAAAVQWLTGASANAVTLEDQIRAVTDAVKAWRDESGKSFADLREEFGSITPEIVAMQREINQLRLADILREADDAARQLSTTMGSGLLSSVGGDLRRLFLSSGVVLGNEVTNEFRSLMESVGTASGVGEQLQAVEQLRARFSDLTGGIRNMSAEQRVFYSGILDAEAALRAAAVATGDVSGEATDAAAAASELASRARSVVDTIASADGSRLVAAFQSAFPIASQLFGMAQGIVSTLGEARAAAAAQDQLDQLAIEFSPGGRALAAFGGRTPGGTAAQNALDLRNRPAVVSATGAGAGAGGGGGGAATEADALQKLIASLEGEIAALRVQDPLQQELLRHREALTGATDAERAKVEELIATRDREKAAVEGLRSAAQMGGNALIDALMGAEDAGRRLIETLLQAGLQAALLGEGPLAGLFGGGEGGGFLGMLLGSISPVKKASGGMITGPGTATSDSIPAMLSNGEFVVNARATSRNRGLLEAINSGGRILGLAEGGMVGAARQAPGAGGGQRPMVQIINQSAEPIREEQGNGPDAEGTVTLIVGRAMGQGRFDRQQRTRFGLTPKVTAR